MQIRLIIYDDSAVFGGHEVMALLGLEGLLKAGIDIVFFFSQHNTKLSESLAVFKEKYSNLSTVETDFYSKKFQGIRNHFEKSFTKKLASQFREFSPDGILVIQGDIEISSQGVLAGKLLETPTISYIPFAHGLEDMGAKLGKWRDVLNRYLLNAPDYFITITEEAKNTFIRLGSKVSIDVVYNGIELGRSKLTPEEARSNFNLPLNKKIIALCGRLESRQKGQDFLVQAVSQSDFLKSEVLSLLVGDGPDEALLKDEVVRLGLADSIKFMGWCNTSLLYPAIDVLVIASRFEGMPLVMLEALVAGVPVVATDRDGMKELLPEYWRYPYGDYDGFIKKLEAVIKEKSIKWIEPLQNQVKKNMSVSAFQDNFVRTVVGKCQQNL